MQCSQKNIYYLMILRYRNTKVNEIITQTDKSTQARQHYNKTIESRRLPFM